MNTTEPTPQPEPLGRVRYFAQGSGDIEYLSKDNRWVDGQPVLVLPWDEEGKEWLEVALGNLCATHDLWAFLRAIAPDVKGSK